MISQPNLTIPEPPDKPDLPDQMSGLIAAAHAVGLQDHKRLLERNARNVERSWRMGMDALGWTDDRAAEDDDEMAGDVKVRGDTHNHYQIPAGFSSSAESGQSAAPNRWLPWMLAAGITAANIGGGAWLLNQLPTGTDTDTSERTTIGLSTE